LRDTARLLSVNVGLPRDIEWKGRIVHTAIWKNPVPRRCRVGRLNVEGDGQGDLAGHSGEQRAVFVYQIESYRHWQKHLNRSDFLYGQFGENFTVEGLADDVVCIGDRYQIGTALFEVTQPRVTCYRVGIRMNEPQMPALLTSSGRPGFYFRVLEEGDVEAGDEIVQVGEAEERMTVAEINALLYLPGHSRNQLERALRIRALSPGWRGSFEALLRSEKTETGSTGNVAPAVVAHAATPGFQKLTVTAIDQESADVISLSMRRADGRALPLALPGQYVVLRLQRSTDSKPILRSYSLSGAVSTERYRISIKIKPQGVAGNYLRERIRVNDAVDVSPPRGSFTLNSGDRPVVLLSGGIGATPVLAMLHALAADHSTRKVLWIHTARDSQHHAFAAEVRRLVRALPNGRSYVCYTKPAANEKPGEGFDSVGRLTQSDFENIGIPSEAEVYLCGPNRFIADMTETLREIGVAPELTHFEVFHGSEGLNPGVAAATKRSPHLPKDDSDTGPLISFSRSGITAHWKASEYQNILELAEACDVPVQWSCRTGVCHYCESGLVSGSVVYRPEPLEQTADGNVLICCSQPSGDVAIDL
jgi:ferredoxin-NADP reductase/MOSC domain-containing protein YiiM